MHVHHLTSVDGEIVFDVRPDVDVPIAAGVRLAEGLTVDDGARLARLRSDMHAVFEIRLAGASVGVRPRLLTPRADTVAAIVDELAELAGDDAVGDLVVEADVGIGGDEVVTGAARARVEVAEAAAGVAVVAAATAWSGGLDGANVAVEGFGSAGESVARAMRDRGARLVAVSTERGAVADAAGLDVDDLVAARDAHGSAFVHHLDLDVHLPRELHELPVDVLVPGPGYAIYDADSAALVRAPVVVPSTLGVYTSGGVDVLRDRGVVALPDIVTAAGATLAHAAPQGLSDVEILGRVERLVGELVAAAKGSKIDPVDYAATLAETFATTWLAIR